MSGRARSGCPFSAAMDLSLPRGLSLFFLLTLFVSFLLNATPSHGCNEAVCASIVSKCTLLKSCECELKPDKTCECCDRCKKCLDYLIFECCSCFGLCPKPNVSEPLRESVVFDFAEAVPSLWDALTEMGDEEDRWDLFTYPVDLHPSLVVNPDASLKRQESSSSSSAASLAQSTLVVGKDTPQMVTVNCTTAYLRQCTSRDKCKTNCVTMGATAGRWFEDGCCECVGHNCPNYGINESRCSACGDEGGDEDDDDLEELSDERLDQEIRELEEEMSEDS